MAARAEQLGAALRTGPADGYWEVDVTMPEAGEREGVG
jgi:hypothetical protein